MPVAGGIVNATLLDEWVHNWDNPLDPFTEPVAVIEDVHAMPKQGVASMFKFGRSLGIAEGVLAGNGCSLRYVTPTKWKRALGLNQDKGASRRRAIELWPSKAGLFKRVKDDGRAEAALIGWWWLKHGDGAL